MTLNASGVRDTARVLEISPNTVINELKKRRLVRKLKEILEPFGIQKFFSDDWGAYERNLDKSKHIVGKRNTQRIERKHLTLRTRTKTLARKTICYSKTCSSMELSYLKRFRVLI